MLNKTNVAPAISLRPCFSVFMLSLRLLFVQGLFCSVVDAHFKTNRECVRSSICVFTRRSCSRWMLNETNTNSSALAYLRSFAILFHVLFACRCSNTLTRTRCSPSLHGPVCVHASAPFVFMLACVWILNKTNAVGVKPSLQAQFVRSCSRV
jgi:hypothetical protein